MYIEGLMAMDCDLPDTQPIGGEEGQEDRFVNIFFLSGRNIYSACHWGHARF